MKKNFLNSLAKERAKIPDYISEIYDTVYNMCLEYIKEINRIGLTDCVFIVPVMIYGKPLYNVKEVSLIVCKKLKKLGLKVNFIQPNSIEISWLTRKN